MINILHSSKDSVIKSAFSYGHTNYEFALEKIYPLLDRFGEQRKAQNKKFYQRLRRDIINGCVMPPITLAFVDGNKSRLVDIAEISDFINRNISDGYILDGMQRMLTLKDASVEDGFNGKLPLYINVIVAERYDFLLYRMITLNNGQKPMTARHQIEMLTQGAFDVNRIELQVITEKQTEGTKINSSFKMSDIAEAYTAYLSGGLHNKNSKIIETKLDEILVENIMESDVTNEEFSFEEIIGEVGRLQVDQSAKDWLRQLNNLIGFTAGAKRSLQEIREIDPVTFGNSVAVFDEAFESMNPSKINVGKFRRELSFHFVKKISTFKDFSVEELVREFHQVTNTD